MLLKVTSTLSKIECIYRFGTGNGTIHAFRLQDTQISEPFLSVADKFKSNSLGLCCNVTVNNYIQF